MVRHPLGIVRPDLGVIEVRACRGDHVPTESVAALYTLIVYLFGA